MPAPLRPTRPIRSPGCTRRVVGDSRIRAPARSSSPVAVIMEASRSRGRRLTQGTRKRRPSGFDGRRGAGQPSQSSTRQVYRAAAGPPTRLTGKIIGYNAGPHVPQRPSEDEMELNENARIDTSQIDDQRGSGGGGGGGIGGLPIGGGGVDRHHHHACCSPLVGGYFGINQAGGDGGGVQTGDNTVLRRSAPQADALEQLDCRNVLYVNSIQDYWADALPTDLRRAVPAGQDACSSPTRCSTGCGSADSGVGPFYCPADDRVYIDLTFYQAAGRAVGRAGRVRPALRARPRVRPPHPGPGRHRGADAPPAGARPGARRTRCR